MNTVSAPEPTTSTRRVVPSGRRRSGPASAPAGEKRTGGEEEHDKHTRAQGGFVAYHEKDGDRFERFGRTEYHMPHPFEQDDKIAAYVDDWGLAFEQGGMPRIAGRIWGWLLICEEEQEPLTVIAQTLGVSKGSVSTNARLLESAGLLKRTAVSGSRQVRVDLAATFRMGTS